MDVAEILAELNLSKKNPRKKLGESVSFRALQRRIILSTISPGMKDVLFFSGKKFGEAYGKRLPKTDLNGAVEAYFNLIRRENLAIPELVIMGEEKVVVRGYECAIAAGMPNIGVKVCDFDSGVQSGLLSALTGKRFISVETKCPANGDPYCEFEIRMLPEERFAEAFG